MPDFHLALLEFQFPALPTLAAASNAALLAQQPVSSPEQCHAMTCTGALSKGHQTTFPVYAHAGILPTSGIRTIRFSFVFFCPSPWHKVEIIVHFLEVY